MLTLQKWDLEVTCYRGASTREHTNTHTQTRISNINSNGINSISSGNNIGAIKIIRSSNNNNNISITTSNNNISNIGKSGANKDSNLKS